jgi:hypothetical protein
MQPFFKIRRIWQRVARQHRFHGAAFGMSAHDDVFATFRTSRAYSALGRETAPHTWTTDARGIRRFPKSVCAWPIFHNLMRLRELQIIRQKVPDDPPSCPKSGQVRYLPAKGRASRWCDRAIVSPSVRTFAIRGFFREARRRRFVLSRNLSFWCGKPADTIARAMAQIPRRTLPATSIK